MFEFCGTGSNNSCVRPPITNFTAYYVEQAMTTSASLDALLRSLQSHLTQQTSHLPHLHERLGLPATALESELETLQEKLIATVEHQVRPSFPDFLHHRLIPPPRSKLERQKCLNGLTNAKQQRASGHNM